MKSGIFVTVISILAFIIFNLVLVVLLKRRHDYQTVKRGVTVANPMGGVQAASTKAQAQEIEAQEFEMAFRKAQASQARKSRGGAEEMHPFTEPDQDDQIDQVRL